MDDVRNRMATDREAREAREAPGEYSPCCPNCGEVGIVIEELADGNFVTRECRCGYKYNSQDEKQPT